MDREIDLNDLDWRALFEALHPGCFEKPSIRRLPEEGTWAEMALALGDFSPETLPIAVPSNIAYGYYEGELAELRRAVNRVDATWPELFDGKQRVWCAADGDRIASFCMIEDMGEYRGLRVGGPGCVGTLPEYRRQGIGLKLVQSATAILKAEGFDLSYIHFTGVAPWYARLGYRTVLRWGTWGICAGNQRGFD